MKANELFDEIMKNEYVVREPIWDEHGNPLKGALIMTDGDFEETVEELGLELDYPSEKQITFSKDGQIILEADIVKNQNDDYFVDFVSYFEGEKIEVEGYTR